MITITNPNRRAASQSPLMAPACTCGVAPRALCLTCARWRKHYITLMARMNGRKEQQ